MKTPKISVIINCYNSEVFLREAIDSVYAQSFKDWEIVLWDNASTDKTSEIAQSYDSRLKYYRGEKNVPLGHARNLALEKCQGEFIAFLDSDDIWLPQKLELQTPLFVDPEVGLVYCDTWFLYEDGKETQLYKGTPFYTGRCFKKLLESYFLSMETVIIRKAALEGLNEYFDETYSMIEEADLFRRISYKWKLDMIPEPMAKWRVHQYSLTWTQPSNFSNETRHMLKKYCKIWPNFEIDFATEIAVINSEVDLNDAKIFWKERNQHKARSLLKPHVLKSPKYLLYFVFTIFPYSFLVYVLRKLGRLAQ